MKAEEREKTITVTEKVYVACDGEEFESEKACIAYEELLQEAADGERVETLRSFDYCPPTGEDNFHWSYIRNEEELQAFIRHWLNSEERNYCDYEDTGFMTELRKFPLWVVAEVDDDGYGAIYSGDDLVRQHEIFIEEVLKKMKEHEEEME